MVNSPAAFLELLCQAGGQAANHKGISFKYNVSVDDKCYE